jgi:hypothetical protein
MIEGHRIYQFQKNAVSRACIQNGEASYTKESLATNNPLLETDKKIQDTM